MTDQIISQVVSRAKQIHLDLNIPSQQLDKFLNYLKLKTTEKPSFVPCGGCFSSKVDVKPAFAKAFNTFSDKEKAEFYLKCVTIARDILENRGEVVPLVREELKTITWNFFNESEKEWETKMIDINYEKLTIRFRSTKQVIDLHGYVLRTSKKKDKEKKILALQATEKVQEPQTIRLSNYKETFQEFSKVMNNLIDCAIKENFARMIDSQTISANKSNVTSSRRPMPQLHLLKANSEIAIKMPSEESYLATSRKDDPQSPFKSAKTVEKDEVIQGQFHKKRTVSFLDQHERTKNRLIESLESQESMIYYRKNFLVSEKESRARKIFQMIQEDSGLPFQWFSDNMMVSSSFKRWKKSLKKSSMISQGKDGTVRVFQERHEFKDRTQGTYKYRRERIMRDQCMYFIDLPTTQKAEPQITGQIEYAIWKFQKKGNLRIIISQAKLCNISQDVSNSAIHILDQFLGSMDYICANLTMTLIHQPQMSVDTIMFEEEFISQIDRFDITDLDEFYSINDNQNEARSHRDMKGKVNQQQISFTFTALNQSQYLSQVNHSNLLKFKHPVKPFPKGRPKYRYPIKQGEHPYFQNQFAFTKEGEMVSINKEKLKAQSSVLKDVLKSIGRNLFSGKSILNISLPVTVLSVQSNLSLICKSYAYAPALLEKAAKETDPVLRMKFIAAFAMTTTVAYLQMDKPFNPILGETFQTIIDGCFVYGEQISHHPPISATFMKGRGYTLYGSFQAKVNMGLNSATGSNQGILHISFDQGNIKKKIVKLVFPPGQVTGLTYGVRKVAATKTGYVLDQENHLFVELNFNRHKGKTQYCKFYDGVQGRIVQLAPGSIPSNPNQVKKKSITRQFGMISGRWTSQIYYEDQLVFDSWKDMPFSCEKYPCPLQSDAYYRKDLIQRVANDYEAAQLAKQELEEIQRNDRKLRKKYTGSQH